MSDDQTPGRGVPGGETREGHPGPDWALAQDADERWSDTLLDQRDAAIEQRDAALATLERVRALLQARAVECPGAEFIAIADIKAALTGGFDAGRRGASWTN